MEKKIKLLNTSELVALLNKYLEKTAFNSFKIFIESKTDTTNANVELLKKTMTNANIKDFVTLSGSGKTHTFTPGIIIMDKDGILWQYVGLSNKEFIDNLSGYPNATKDDDLSYKKISLGKLLLTAGIIKMNYQKNGYEFNGNLHATAKSSNGAGNAIFASLNDSPQFGTLYVYSSVDPTKFARYSIYKASNSTSPVYYLLQNNGLSIAATNTLGTIAMNDTSDAIKMVVEIFVPNFS